MFHPTVVVNKNEYIKGWPQFRSEVTWSWGRCVLVEVTSSCPQPRSAQCAVGAPADLSVIMRRCRCGVERRNERTDAAMSIERRLFTKHSDFVSLWSAFCTRIIPLIDVVCDFIIDLIMTTSDLHVYTATINFIRCSSAGSVFQFIILTPGPIISHFT